MKLKEILELEKFTGAWKMTRQYLNLKNESGFYWVYESTKGYKLIYPVGRNLKKSLLESSQKFMKDREKIKNILEKRE